MSSDAPYPNKNGHHSIAVIKEQARSSSTSRHNSPVLLTPQDSVPQRPSARNTPMLSIQPHHTEISTHRPSVSGRIFLHIPKLARKKMHFISLALHLRLRESISWTRQDLMTFEMENQSWSQTVWDKKIMLPFQDRQVEEGGAPFVAVVNEPFSSKGKIEIEADEWRWEWLMPITENEVRPESFEGSMANLWYELEAKCLFRWDDVDKDGNVEVVTSSPFAMEATLDSGTVQESSRQTGTTLMKGLESSSKKAKSLAQALGKLRVGNKTKKSQHVGDFKLGSQHDEFIERSLRMRDAILQGTVAIEDSKTLLSASARGQSAPHLGLLGPASTEAPSNHTHKEPPPFLIRKILKLYFIKPPPSTSSSKDFFLPPPSMALPTLPGTRRVKAIIPESRIQVQIQIPSLIPIRGYSQTSQLVPDHKKGALVYNKYSAQNTDNQQHHHVHHNSQEWEVHSRHLDSFQVALTIRKVTQTEINDDPLKKRYQSASGTDFTPASVNSGDALSSEAAADRKGMLGASMPNASLPSQHTAGSAEGGETAAGGPGRPWRKEIRVRKVKCEFWQKESCRVPSDSPDTNSRTVKYALGPAFTYSEKDQERERTRSSMQLMSLSASQVAHHETSQRTATTASANSNANTIFWDAGASGPGAIAGDQEHQIRKNSNSASPLSPVMKPTSSMSHQQSTATPSFLKASVIPYVSGRKESDTSLHTSPALQPTSTSTPQASRPFMLLFLVPLDSPHLRQTFTWPTPETSLSLLGSRHNPTSLPVRPFSNNDIDFDTPTPQSLYRMAMMGAAADNAADERAYDPPEVLSSESNSVSGDMRGNSPPTTGRYERNRGHLSRGSARPRIEVKHYLSIRLSMDILEFEGELEQDEEVDLKAMEELQLQQVMNRQELSAYRPSFSSFDSAATCGAAVATSSIASPRDSTTIPPSGGDSQEQPRYGSGIARNGMISSSTPGTSSSMPSMHMADPSSSTMQPALSFLNSTAGLLDLDTDLEEETSSSGYRTHPGNRSLGSSSNSLHYERPTRSNSSSGSALLGSSPQPQPLLGAVYDLDQRRGSGASQGTMKSSTSGGSAPRSGSSVSGRLIKKKASSSGLKDMVNAVMKGNIGGGSGGQQGQSQSWVGAISSNALQAHRRHRSSAATVQKLKDFVIRVPITVVVQVNDLSSVGTTAMTDGGDSVTYMGNTATPDGSNASEGTDMRATMTTGYGSEFQSTTTVDSMDDNGSMRDEPATTIQKPTMRGENSQEQQKQQQLRYLAHVGEGEDSEHVEGQFMVDHDL